MLNIIGFCDENCPENGFLCVSEKREMCTYCGSEIDKQGIENEASFRVYLGIMDAVVNDSSKNRALKEVI